MATNLRKAVGQFLAITSGTTQSVIVTDPTTGLPFQPKVVIFFQQHAVNPDSTLARFSIGLSDGTNQRFSSWAATGGVSTTVATSTTNDTKCVAASGPAASAAMTATGFDLTWSSTPATAEIINYIALGGTDITNVAIGTDTMPITAIAKSVTGLGFVPNFVMILSNSQTVLNTTANTAHFSYGCAISPTARFSHTLNVQNGQTLSANVNGVSIHKSDSCLQGLLPGGTNDYSADFTSFDSDGFTITFTNAPVSAFKFFYLAIAGQNLKWDIGTAARPTSATVQSDTSVSFKPEIVWWSNSSLTTLSSVTANAALSFGASDGTNDECTYATHNDAIPTVAGTQTAAKAAQDGVPADSSVQADFTSFDSGGWTITWGGTGSADQISAVSLAGTDVPSASALVEMGEPDFQFYGGERY